MCKDVKLKFNLVAIVLIFVLIFVTTWPNLGTTDATGREIVEANGL